MNKAIETMENLIEGLANNDKLSSRNATAWAEVERLAKLGAAVENTLDTIGDVGFVFDGNLYVVRIETRPTERDWEHWGRMFEVKAETIDAAFSGVLAAAKEVQP